MPTPTAIYNLLFGRAPAEPDHTKDMSPEDQVAFIMAAAEKPGTHDTGAMSNVLRRKLPFTPEQILRLLHLSATGSYYFPYLQVLRLVSSLPMTPEIRQALEALRRNRFLQPGEYMTDVARRVDQMLAPRDVAEFKPAGPWSQAIAAEVTPEWREVLGAGAAISGATASGKWRQAAGKRAEAIGREAFRATALRWLAVGPSPGVADQQVPIPESEYQRGLLWSLAAFNDAEMCSAVARFAEQSLRKIAMVGAVSQKSANACINVLAAMDGMEPVAQLARLAMRVKYQTAQRLVQEALDEAAERQCISRDQLAEVTVPDFGLDASGIRTENLGGVKVELDHAGHIAFFASDGRPLKSAPESVKRGFAVDLKDLKTAAKEIAVMRSAHTLRIERLLLSQREIPLATWRSSYLEHPLLASTARSLIWQFPSGATAST